MRKRGYYIILFCLVASNVISETPTVSVSDVKFTPCQTTHSIVYLDILPNEVWNGYSFPESGDYVRCISNSRGCDSLVLLHVTLKHGMLPGEFSISPIQKVHFSQGNLQFCAAPSTGINTHMTMDGLALGIWRFALNQWDICGPDCKTLTSATYSGWVDYFGYGTSGYAGVMPYLTATSTSSYPMVDIVNTNYDWGRYNAISNGGNEPGLWFTMSQEQWQYLFETRTNATILRSAATIHNVNGIVILPDDWVAPVGITFLPNQTAYTANIISDSDWNLMENAGAVFLPRASARDQTAQGGRYWGSTMGTSSGQVKHFRFNDSGVNTTVTYSFTSQYYNYTGYCVRLVK